MKNIDFYKEKLKLNNQQEVFNYCSFKQGTRHYIYTIVNIIEELK